MQVVVAVAVAVCGGSGGAYIECTLMTTSMSLGTSLHPPLQLRSEAKAGELARVVEHHHLAGEEAGDVLMYVYMNEYIICEVL